MPLGVPSDAGHRYISREKGRDDHASAGSGGRIGHVLQRYEDVVVRGPEHAPAEAGLSGVVEQLVCPDDLTDELEAGCRELISGPDGVVDSERDDEARAAAAGKRRSSCSPSPNTSRKSLASAPSLKRPCLMAERRLDIAEHVNCRVERGRSGPDETDRFTCIAILSARRRRPELCWRA